MRHPDQPPDTSGPEWFPQGLGYQPGKGGAAPRPVAVWLWPHPAALVYMADRGWVRDDLWRWPPSDMAWSEPLPALLDRLPAAVHRVGELFEGADERLGPIIQAARLLSRLPEFEHPMSQNPRQILLLARWLWQRGEGSHDISRLQRLAWRSLHPRTHHDPKTSWNPSRSRSRTRGTKGRSRRWRPAPRELTKTYLDLPIVPQPGARQDRPTTFSLTTGGNWGPES